MNLFDSTEKVACAMLPMVHSHIIESIMPMVNKEIKLNYILPYSAAIPKRRHEHWHREFTRFVEKGIIQRKMVDILQVALILNGKQAIVMFPSLKGELDMNSAFVGSDSVFLEWCLDYFNHIWGNARPYRSEKLNEV